MVKLSVKNNMSFFQVSQFQMFSVLNIFPVVFKQKIADLRIAVITLYLDMNMEFVSEHKRVKVNFYYE